MSVDLTKPELDTLDQWYEDEIRPKKYAPDAARWNKSEVKSGRDELFEAGSGYLATNRDEIVGIDNVLVEIDQVIHWLKHSKAYRKHGSRLEPGVIFEGDPGTGKTLVSRYIATQADALFINVRDFPKVGTLFTDSDIRDLFTRARRKVRELKRPVILFWDEFENGACERSNATPDQVATVSQLTAELDGIAGKEAGILLIGCTNYIYGIDAALKRSGRMGLHIEFAAPDREGKRLLLEHYLGQYRTRGQIDVETLAYFFDSDATAADIEEACVEAWRYAVRRIIDANGDAGRKRPALAQKDLVDVFLKRLVGPPSAFINLPLERRHRIAVHECGHAIMALIYGIPLRLITVQPGKKSLGRVILAEMEEHIGTMDEMVSYMRAGIGSIVAEEIANLPASMGSFGDVSSINETAAKLVDNLYAGDRTALFSGKAVAGTRMGQTKLTTPNVGPGSVEDSDRDIRSLLDRTHADAKQVMGAIGHDNLHEIARRVNKAVTLTGEEFGTIFRGITKREPESYLP